MLLLESSAPECPSGLKRDRDSCEAAEVGIRSHIAHGDGFPIFAETRHDWGLAGRPLHEIAGKLNRVRKTCGAGSFAPEELHFKEIVECTRNNAGGWKTIGAHGCDGMGVGEAGIQVISKLREIVRAIPIGVGVGLTVRAGQSESGSPPLIGVRG